jgi:hypothetical protein
MTRIASKTGQKSWWFSAVYVPANRSEETRFGPADSAVIASLLLTLVSLICALAAFK